MRRTLRKLEDQFACGIARCVPDMTVNLPIFGYHRVADLVPGAASSDQPTWNAAPGMLRSQLTGLMDAGFEPISLAEAIASHGQPEDIGSNRFCVTFDDGFANNFTAAADVLRDLGVPATFFLATAYVDSTDPFPFDDWSLCGTQRVPTNAWIPASLDQCHQILGDDLFAIGGHTHCHGDFRNRLPEFEQDILESRDYLETQFGIKNPPFAFPFGITRLGFVSPQMIESVRRAGYTCALNFDNRITPIAEDPYHWSRIQVESFDTAGSVLVKARGSYSRVRDWIETGTSLIRPSRWTRTRTEFQR